MSLCIVLYILDTIEHSLLYINFLKRQGWI